MKVLLVAEESAGAHALRLLVQRGADVAGVLTDADAGAPGSVAAVAAGHGIERFGAARVRDPGFARWIGDAHVDLLLNVHSLAIAAGATVAAPRIGSFNLHPGPLPAYAGLNAPSWAIADGRTRHAVTLHWMAPEVDAGPVAYEAWFDVAPHDTGLRVAVNCVRHGLPLLERLLSDATRDPTAIPARPQDPRGRRWHGREVPHGGRVPWASPARRVANLVRAADYAPFPSPWGTFTTVVDGVEVEIVRVAATAEAAGQPPGTVASAPGGEVRVAAADAWVIVERVRVDGVAVDPTTALEPGQRCMPLG